MKEPETQQVSRVVCLYTLVAGSMDTSVGMMLIFFPRLTLAAMLVSINELALPFVSFVGAFVFANGSLYLWALWWRKSPVDRLPLLTHIWLITGWVRLCVGLTTAGLITAGKLSPTWISVPASDLALAAFQFTWIAQKRLSTT